LRLFFPIEISVFIQQPKPLSRKHYQRLILGCGFNRSSQHIGRTARPVFHMAIISDALRLPTLRNVSRKRKTSLKVRI